MKKAVFLFTALLALTIAANAQGIAVGATMENFSLPDLEGKMQTLDSLKGKNGAVIIFLSAQCPVVKGYNERIAQIAAEYNRKGIAFIGINSNSTESLDWVKSNAAENYKFPVLIDKGNKFADKIGATVTPEVYFTDAKNVLVYHGAIDNDRAGTNITDMYLKAAFEATLGGKRVEKTSAKAFGCTIKRVGM
jgi:peroxiredoxin